MPLLKGRKNIGHNIEVEMHAGKPKQQSLAIALNVSRKKKKPMMAKGGEVKDSAKMESRPMPEERAKDSKMVSQNSGKKSMDHDFKSESRPMPPSGPSKVPLKHPSIMKGGTFSTKLRSQEDDLEMLAKPGSPKEQPREEYNEESPDRQGPKVHPMKKMANGGMIDADHSGNKHNKSIDDEYGDGAEEDEQVEPAGLEEDNDEMSPSEDEIMSNKMQGRYAKGGEVNQPIAQIKGKDTNYLNKALQGASKERMEREASSNPPKIQFKAEGGEIEDDDMMQPHEEEAIDHAASIAAAIMAKRKMMADGGQVDLDENAEEQPNSFYHQNEDEALKENYDSDMEDVSQPMDSNEHGHDIDSDKHDMVSMIRRKMKMKNAMVK